MEQEKKAGQANRDWWASLPDHTKTDLMAQVAAFGNPLQKKLCDPDTHVGLQILKQFAEASREVS